MRFKQSVYCYGYGSAINLDFVMWILKSDKTVSDSMEKVNETLFDRLWIFQKIPSRTYLNLYCIM